VYECGASYRVTTASSISAASPRVVVQPGAPSGALAWWSRARVATRVPIPAGIPTRRAIVCASGPLKRTTASAPRPAAVATAAIVSPR
jgi:hypothetical protein